MVDQATPGEDRESGNLSMTSIWWHRPVPGTLLGTVLPRGDHIMSMERKNTHSPAGKPHWTLPSTDLPALAAEPRLVMLP